MRILMSSLFLSLCFMLSPAVADDSNEQVTKTVDELEETIQQQKSYEQLKREVLDRNQQLDERNTEQLLRKYQTPAQDITIPRSN